MKSTFANQNIFEINRDMPAKGAKTREEKLMNMITACGGKLEQITLTLEKLSESIENLKQ